MLMKYRVNYPIDVFLTRLSNLTGVIAKLWIAVIVVAVSACASPETLESIHDPYEEMNRRTHALNKNLDKALLKPASGVYAAIVPDELGTGIRNFAGYLDIPGEVANNLLQFDLAGAATNSARFVINGTVGFLGLYDAASEIGLYPDAADFGQTLHVWGVGEGAFVELPVLGASTERDAVGIAVDAVFNPMTLALPSEWKLAGTGAKTVSMVGDRARFATTVDSVLYESADSYSQSRLYYLQSRRHELGMKPDEDDYFDPYEDIYE